MLQNAIGLGPWSPNSVSTAPPFRAEPKQHGVQIADLQVHVHRRPVPLVVADVDARGAGLVPAGFSCMHTVRLFASSTAIVGNGRAVSMNPNTRP